MKRFLFCFFIFFISNSFSQEIDPRLFQTWFLEDVISNAFGDLFVVSEIDPVITPTLTFTEEYNYYGEAACNEFHGSFSFEPFDILEFGEITSDGNVCEFEIHNDFEIEYFHFLGITCQYTITENENGLVLYIGNIFEGSAHFRNYKLSNDEFELNNISVYPIPAKSKLIIDSNSIEFTQMEIFNISGEKLNSIKGNLKSVDISNLPSGVYFLKLYIETKAIIRKFIKE